jgi:hypothetical protein
MQISVRAAVLGLAVIVAPSDAVAQTPVSRGWSITYADGRTVTNPLLSKAGMWTPNFPRVPGADTSHNGRPLGVLDISYVADGDDVAATITLVYGQFEDRVTVAQVRVTPGRRVVVGELEAYGVAPIALAIVRVEPALALPFVAEEPSGQLEIRVEPVAANTPLYRIVLENHAARDLRAIDYSIYQGEVRLGTGRRKAERNEPLVAAGAEYSFQYWPSQSPGKPPRTPDRLVVTSVMWDDGSVDGGGAGAGQEHAMAVGRQRQLEQLLAALNDGAAPSIERLRAAFLALGRRDYALEHEREAALKDLDRLERAGDPAALRQWTTSKQAETFAWLARVNHVLQ